MDKDLTRRTVLKGGGAAVAGYTVMRLAGPAHAFPGGGEGTVIPWLDQPGSNPIPEGTGNLLVWEELVSRITPADNFFWVRHYNLPELDPDTWQLEIGGLVARPHSLSLGDLKARPRREVEFTLECSGNTGPPLPFFIGGVGNAVWAGTPLARVLERARPVREGTEVIFWGADKGPVEVVGGWNDAPFTPKAFTEQFARSMSIDDAMAPDNLLCYEMNGRPLPVDHGFPVRLIAPGWYGVANVKWLTRIEVTDHRYAGQFMARDYVTIRQEQRDGQEVWTFAVVSRNRLKSAPAKVIRRGERYEIVGAAWGAPIDHVDVAIDHGPWMPARLVRTRRRGGSDRAGYSWVFWTFDWGTPVAGEHTVTSRAFDTDGNVQPPPDDPFYASKRTFWESNGQITRRVRIG